MGLVWSGGGSQDRNSESYDPEDDPSERARLRAEEMLKFKEELSTKAAARREAMAGVSTKLKDLREDKESLLKENEELKRELEEVKRTSDDGGRDEEVDGLERQVKALKEVAMIGGEMLRIRELQVNELKSKLAAIEETGAAYEKEVENMRRLRGLYEERARAVTISHQMELERERTRVVAAETRQSIAEQRTAELEAKNAELESRLAANDQTITELRSEVSEVRLNLAGTSEDLYNVTSQMGIVNRLFGQLLTPGSDSLEKITRVLEEHHDLVNHLTAKGRINELASTLYELADKDHLPEAEKEDDITEHLSKVWRLLVELLGHHVKPTPETAIESCYKSVDTPAGPKLVISVSQTFLRLKDLILEKNTLVKEVGRLKELNSTLEGRLGEQEDRLRVVAEELHTTWGVVSKLKTQHKQLHSHEKMLRYELAQKRVLLNELKEELENCKENWTLARAKNSQTEEDWRVLRSEFALRKQGVSSAESGYEESPTDSQDEEEWKDKSVTLLPWSDPEPVPESDPEPVVGPDLEPAPEPTPKPEPTTAPSEEGAVGGQRTRTAQEILDARQARLQRLEEQCQGLFSKMSQTSARSDVINSRLVELHEIYGEEGRQRRRQDSDPTTSSEPDTPN